MAVLVDGGAEPGEVVAHEALGGVGAFDDHGRQGLPRGSLEGCLPARVDVDHVEEGAEHTVDVGQSLGAGARPSFVEGKGQRLGARS